MPDKRTVEGREGVRLRYPNRLLTLLGEVRRGHEVEDAARLMGALGALSRAKFGADGRTRMRVFVQFVDEDDVRREDE